MSRHDLRKVDVPEEQADSGSDSDKDARTEGESYVLRQKRGLRQLNSRKARGNRNRNEIVVYMSYRDEHHGTRLWTAALALRVAAQEPLQPNLNIRTHCQMVIKASPYSSPHPDF